MSQGRGSPSNSDASSAPGQRLKAERERRGLSLQQVADDLHVSVGTVEALEAGRFAALGAPVYAKGHLRKYARLLRLDAEKLVSACETEQPPVPELVPLQPATRTGGKRARPAAVVTAIVAVIAALVTAVVGWMLWKRAENPAAATEPRVVANAPAQPATSTGELVAEARPAPQAPPIAPARPETAKQEHARSESAAAPVHVRMSFSADSWVEVYDASEQRVFFDMGTTGTTRIVTAAAPLRVFLGFADGVQLELDGQAVAVPPEAKRGNLAEFSLDAHGRVRPERSR